MALKLYSYPGNFRGFKPLIAAKYAGVEIELPPFNFPADAKTKEFLAKNPLGKVPVLETPEGPIFESNAILRYVARQDKSNVLYGSDAYTASVIDQWIDFSANELELPIGVWIFPIFGFIEFNPDATEKAKVDVKKALDVLNQHLLNHTYLVGEQITIADIAVACSLFYAYKLVFDTKFRKPFGNVTRWYRTVVRQPNFAAILGEVELATTMAVAKPSEKKPEPAKPEPEKPKKADEGAKQANPLDLLPPSKLNLEEWKRVYSNADDTRGDAMKWFWEHLDEGYSLWLAEYKYPDELESELLTTNLLGGFIQRLDRLRKYGFASLIMFGNQPKLEVGGVFLVRGQEIPFELSDTIDSENYDWRKIDITKDSEKTLVEDYFAWDGEFGGRELKFTLGKIMK